MMINLPWQKQNEQYVVEFGDIFRLLPDPMAVLKHTKGSFVVENATDSFLEVIGESRSDVIERTYKREWLGRHDTQGLLQRSTSDILRAAYRAKKPTYYHMFKEGDPGVFWRITLHPMRDNSGRSFRLVQTFSDVTKEVMTSRKLEEAKLHLESALAAGKVGSWTWSGENGRIVGDSGFLSVFNLSEATPKQGVLLKDLVEQVHAGDREGVKRVFGSAYKTSASFDTEFRIGEGEQMKWLICRGQPFEVDGKKQFSGVIVDVTERRDLQAQVELARQQDKLNRREAKMLKERNEELQSLNRSKDEFVAIASHQLRTPATAVKQYLGMVLQGYAGDVPDRQKEMLERAFESNERQVDIINQILNAARADTGKLTMSLTAVDINAVVQGVVAEQKSTIESKGQRVTVSLPKKPVIAQVDHIYLRMAVENLLNNASKYTDDGGTIQVSLRRRGDEVTIVVEDSGVGIATEDIDKLFVKFTRIHNPLSVRAGGSGIGLYLASEIAKLHGGGIKVRSKVGKGSVFELTIISGYKSEKAK